MPSHQAASPVSVSLAATFNPRGEIPRLGRILPQLRSAYAHIAVIVPPHTRAQQIEALNELVPQGIGVSGDWSHGRRLSLEHALRSECTHVHYADTDRLIRWIETRPDEWRQAVRSVGRSECLVIGRSESAWETHPGSLRETERLTNTIFSHWLGEVLDLSAGSKGFSRSCARFILANSRPGRALGTDSEWVVLAHRGGFQISTLLVDGLDWETPDRYQSQAASGSRQRKVGAIFDADARNWEHRVRIANEILAAGLEALQRRLGDHV